MFIMPQLKPVMYVTTDALRWIANDGSELAIFGIVKVIVAAICRVGVLPGLPCAFLCAACFALNCSRSVTNLKPPCNTDRASVVV